MGRFETLFFNIEKQLLINTKSFLQNTITAWSNRIAHNETRLFPVQIETIVVEDVTVDSPAIELYEIEQTDDNDIVDMLAFNNGNVPRIPNLKRYYAAQKAKKRLGTGVISVDFVSKSRSESDTLFDMFVHRMNEVDLTNEDKMKIIRGIKDPEYYKTLERRYQKAADCVLKFTDPIDLH